MIKCAACGHDNVDGTTFCEMCGEDLQSTDSAAAAAGGASTPAPDVAATGGDIKCPACENMNPPENVVCEVCGTELRGLAGDDDEETVATSSSVAAGSVDSAAGTGTSGTATGSATADPDLADAAPAPDAPSTPTADSADASTVDPAPAPATTAPDTDAAPVAAGTPAAALKPGTVKLVVEQGMTVGKQFTLGDAEMHIGREDEEENIYPDIDLADQDEGYVHRQHASLKFENDQLFVTHLGGANKTRVNNRPIPDNTPQPVNIGDKIAFGKVVMRLLPL